MEVDVEQHEPPAAEHRFRRRIPRIGMAGLILLPIALVIYLIAMPLFGLFWLIEWMLPLQPPGSESLMTDFPRSRLHSRAEDSVVP